MTPGTNLTPVKNYRPLRTTDLFRLFTNGPIRLLDEPFALFRPFTPFTTFTDEAATTVWTPLCDIYETEKEIVLKAELPEVKKENVSVTLENNVLTLKGERKFEETTNNETYHRVERFYGDFMRNFTLPTFVDPSRIKADFKEGILTITLPKKEDARPKAIQVKVK